MKKRYYVSGVCGTGKSTVAAELNRQGIRAIDQDSPEYSLCRWKNNGTKEDSEFYYGAGKEFLETNDYYCNIEKLKMLLNSDDDVLFVCGVSANQDEYLNLFDKVFLLQCAPEIFSKRIDERTDNRFGKDIAEKEHILNWYTELEEGLIRKGAIVIQSDRSVGDVVGEILVNV